MHIKQPEIKIPVTQLSFPANKRNHGMTFFSSEIEAITKLIVFEFLSLSDVIVRHLKNMNDQQFKMFFVDLDSLQKKQLNSESKFNPILRDRRRKVSTKLGSMQIDRLIRSIVWFFPLDCSILNQLKRFPPFQFKSCVAKIELVQNQRRNTDRQCEIQELLNLAGLQEVLWTEMFDSSFDQENGAVFCYSVSFTFPGMELPTAILSQFVLQCSGQGIVRDGTSTSR